MMTVGSNQLAGQYLTFKLQKTMEYQNRLYHINPGGTQIWETHRKPRHKIATSHVGLIPDKFMIKKQFPMCLTQQYCEWS